jgi:hypothetical protein
MRFVRTAIIAGVASAALAGAALAAQDSSRMMLVAHPDGTVEHIPVQQVQLIAVPAAPAADLFEAAFGPASAFAEMDRVAAAMEAQAAAMMRQAATMQAQMPAQQAPGVVMTNAQGQPVGVMHYSFVSSSTDANGCTQTVRYSSDGATAADQPRVIRTSAGNCDGQASPAPGIIAPATRAPHRVTPTTVKPAKPAPRIIPVSAPKPEEVFTPSRT